jgi:uncharacterized MnhB-related membrane protein
MAGADMTQVSSIPPPQRKAVRAIVDEGFVFAFRFVILAAAGLALAAAGFGAAIRQDAADPAN